MKKVLSLVLALSMLLALCSCGSSTTTDSTESANPGSSTTAATHDPVTVTLGTASSSGTFYAMGAGIANLFSQYSDFLSLMVQATSGGTENVELVHSGELEFGCTTTSYAACAIDGSGFLDGEEPKDVAGVMALYSSMYQMLVRADAGIDTYADFKDSGLRVCLGSMVAEQQAVSDIILRAHGVDPDTDITAVYLTQDEACEKLADGDIDAAVIYTGVPAALFTNLVIDNKFKLVDADPDILAELTAEGGELEYEIQTVIPAGTYNNDADVNTVCSKALIFCSPDLEDAVVYEFCKQVYEHYDELKMSHSSLEDVVLSDLDDTVITLHPGAEAYYKEIGILD